MTKYDFECLDTHIGRRMYSLNFHTACQVVQRIVEDPLKAGYTGYWKVDANMKPLTLKTLSDNLKALHGVWKNMRRIHNWLVPAVFLDGTYINTYGEYISRIFNQIYHDNPETQIGNKMEAGDGTGHLHACGIWVYIYDIRSIKELLFIRKHPGETKPVADETEVTGIACSDKAFIGQKVLSALDKLQGQTIRIEDLY
jgi:hypothetical protein